LDLVYFCRDGENEELRYSIRSAVKNLPHDNLWVVGKKPDWYSGNFINVDKFGDSYDKVREALKVASNTEEISEEFILMNDDFFIVKPVSEVEHFYIGTLKDRIESRRSGGYSRLLQKTHKDLSDRKYKDPLDYELHIPMRMTKTGVARIIEMPGLWRSSFGNVFAVGGTQRNDVKLYTHEDWESRTDLHDSEYLSTNDKSFPQMHKKIFKDMFPEPSVYES
jgi:hypothetical protein